MKQGIHPKYYPESKVICSCGHTFTTGSTQEVIRTDVCSACHPFFTGEQRIVDTAGQVERFMRRLEKREELSAEEAAPAEETEDKLPVKSAAPEAKGGKKTAKKAAAPKAKASKKAAAPKAKSSEKAAAEKSEKTAPTEEAG